MIDVRWTVLGAAALALAACGGESGDGGGGETAAEAPSGAGGSAAASASMEMVDGTITATINGEARTWYVTSDTLRGEYVSQSDWRRWGGAGPVSITLFGHAAPNTVLSSNEALMVDFTAWSDGPERPIDQAEITFLSGGLMNHHSSDAGGSASVELEELTLDDGSLTVRGRFTGALAHRAMTGDGPANDIAEYLIEDGAFEATIREEQ